MGIRTEANDGVASRNSADTGANRGALESTALRERCAVSGASRETRAPFSPYEREMRQVLAEMALIQYGRTQAFNASGGKDTDRDPRPSGESHPMHDYWAEEWARDPSERTLNAARAELRAWKVRTAPAEGDGSSEDDWVIEDGEGLTPDEAAMKFKRTPAMIRRLRLREDRDSERGLPYDKPSERVPDAQTRVLNLASQGCTLKQIALQTSVPRETVRRWMRDAA